MHVCIMTVCVCVRERERNCMCAVCVREGECSVCVREREREIACMQCVCVRERETGMCACDRTVCVHAWGGDKPTLVQNDCVGGRVWIHGSSQLQCKVKCSVPLHMLDRHVTVDDSFSWHCCRWYSPLW